MKTRAFAFMLTAILLGAAALAGSVNAIDNCCFVDRQCQSDQDWVNGYWAFQNNQCSAPAGSLEPVSSQPTGAPAQIDNCCFVDRQCHTDQEWVDGYWAFQNNQCTAAGQSERSVEQADNMRRALRIEGSARFIAAVNAALDLLKARAPRWYIYTVFGYDLLLEVPNGTIVSFPDHVKFHLVDPGDPYLNDTGGFVGHLVHYAAHNYQDQRDLASGAGRSPVNLEDEREALTFQIEAMAACCPGHPLPPRFRHILANIENPEYQWWLHQS